jgi:hypothetical protein
MGFANYGLVSGECRFKPEPIGTPPRRSSNRTIVALAHRVRRIAVSPVVPSEPPACHSSPTARGLVPPPVCIRRLPTEVKRSKPSFSAGI